MPAAETDIRTGHAASYLARLCGHAAKMSQSGHRLSHRPPATAAAARPRSATWHAPGRRQPSVWTAAGGPYAPFLTVTWQTATAEARTTAGPEDHQAERGRVTRPGTG